MSLEEYIADIIRVPMLTCEEEIILGAQVQNMMKVLKDNKIGEQILQETLSNSIKTLNSQDKKIVKIGLKARNRMISANMRLVVAVAKKAKTTQMHLAMQDLIQEGAIGLARATEKFEPGRGYKFSTYAYWWIRQGITRATEYQEKTIRLPSNVQKMIRQIKDAKHDLTVKFGRSPTIVEIASEIDENIEKVRKIIFTDTSIVSLDCNISQGEDSSTLLEFIASDDGSDAADAEDRSAKIDIILMLVAALPKDEQVFVCQKYGIGRSALSVKEMAEYHRVSEQVVRQKQQKVVNKIRYAAALMQAANFSP